MTAEKYRLNVCWVDRPQTLGDFVDSAVAFLLELEQLHPLFREPLFVLNNRMNGAESVATDLSNLENITRRYGWDRQADSRWLTGVLADGTMDREGTCRLGFRLSIRSFSKMMKPTDFSLSLSGGRNGQSGLSDSLLIDFPSSGWPEFEDISLVKRLLDLTVRHFDPEFGIVATTKFCMASKGRNLYQSIGWMNYWSDPLVGRDMPPNADCESFGPGGLLHTLQRVRPSFDDADAIARANVVMNALLPGQWFEFQKLRGAAEVV
jgi:hypothetical protein